MKEKNEPTIEIPEKIDLCPYCDEPLGEDKTFCHKCGKYLGKRELAYKPISEKAARIIRWAIGIASVALFLIVYFFLIKK